MNNEKLNFEQPHYQSANRQTPNSLEMLLHRMTNRIRQSLELSVILAGVTDEVRAFLGTDRVKVYQFEPGGSGEVVAESLNKQNLPSLLGQHFPAEDIPLEIRQLYRTKRERTVVNVASRQIGMSSLPEDDDHRDSIQFRTVDPCHAEYLTAMGVQSSLVVPIMDDDRLWGLLVSHHSSPHIVTPRELEVLQLVADQTSIAIAQSSLLESTRIQAEQEASINRVGRFLHSMTQMELQQALRQTVLALKGSGGRVYLAPPNSESMAQLYISGEQPVLLPREVTAGSATSDINAGGNPKASIARQRVGGVPPLEATVEGGYGEEAEEARVAEGRKGMSSKTTSPPLSLRRRGLLNGRSNLSPLVKQKSSSTRSIEEHSDWQAWLQNTMQTDNVIHPWASAELDANSLPLSLERAFRPTKIKSILTIQLEYRQKKLGYLSIFRQGIDLETIWAKRQDPDDSRNQVILQSFETWREIKLNQVFPWTEREIELAQILGSHFAIAIYQYQLYQQVNTLNTTLEGRVQERTAELEQTNQKLVQVISDRLKTRADLERVSHQNELILNSAGEGIYGLDTKGKITFINPAAAQILGYDVTELQNQPMHEIVNHSTAEGIAYSWLENPIYQTIQTGEVHYVTNEIFSHKDKSSFPVEYVSTPIMQKEQIVGAVVIFKDITERQIIDRMKDEFVSVVSHELRTPLTSIRSSISLLSSGRIDPRSPKSQRLIEIAQDNSNRLVRLINDILDLERIKSGKVTMLKSSCNAADVMRDAVEIVQSMADKAEIKIAVEPLPVELWIDRDRIIQTLTNLLSNAIKFSAPHTTVTLDAHLQRDNQVRFQVQDCGRGIPPEHLETIFDRFQQVDASDSRDRGGTGLGLAICRSIVQQHGGQIWVESILGKGSRFCFVLPINDR